MAVADYKKVRCVWCKYEFAVKALAKDPRCRCGSRRLEPISDFSVLKPFRALREGDGIMAKKTTPEYSDDETPAPKKAVARDDDDDEMDDIDRDILGD